ncbi:DMT family transporter [Cellulomonas sp. P24]|uniref:DMT family transporter n=1 Tax=Cellulomonas sp. P24 TaxID=2885206 RepID=UPI00216AE8C1|nr:DMT family transporter [Cellulomonas sp. P24]MCR6492546.1 DMT family transporter [Cellulomonas sp. P24]
MSTERLGSAEPVEQTEHVEQAGPDKHSGPDKHRGVAPSRSVRTVALLPVAAMAVTILLWASAFVAIRHLGPTVSPGALTLGRLTVGSLVLGAVLLTRREVWPRRADWPRLVAIGVLWFAIYNVALNAAEHRVDAGTAAMLVNIGPVLLALLAGMRLGEGFPRPLIVGSVIGFGGVVVIGVATSTGTQADVWGVVLCVVAAVAYAVAVILQKPVLARSSSLMVTWVACTVGVVVCLPFAPQLVSELGAAGPGSAAGVVYLGLGPTALGFTLWGYALARTNAGRLGATTYLVPPVAILLGWALLAEVPPVLALLGGGLCLVGVWVTRRPSR